MREDLLQVFTELVPQLNNNKDKAKLLYNIIENINKNNFILILDNISLNKLIKDKTILNNYLFIIGEIPIDMSIIYLLIILIMKLLMNQ